MKAILIKFNVLSNKLTKKTVNWKGGYLFKSHSPHDNYEIWFNKLNSVESIDNYFLIFTTPEKNKVRNAKLKLLRCAMKTTRRKLNIKLIEENKLYNTENALFDMLPPSLK